jgi:Uma2 family endonuclease
LEYDRTVKSSLYAEAGIEHYWIFNVLDRQLEQLRSPIQLANGTYQYATRQIHLAHQTVNLPDPLSGAIVLAEVLA